MNYYFDMDGVLVQYDREAYTGDNPLFLQKNSHYFRDLKPDRRALSLIDAVWRDVQKSNEKKSEDETPDDVFILTSIYNHGAIFSEHLHDKLHWLHKWLPYIDVEHVFISVTSKHDAVEYIKDKALTSDDILIDDYNRNLEEWRKAGGRPVKYLNGLNDPKSFTGCEIHCEDNVADNLRVLKTGNLLNNKKVRNKNS